MWQTFTSTYLMINHFPRFFLINDLGNFTVARIIDYWETKIITHFLKSDSWEIGFDYTNIVGLKTIE